VSRAVCLTCFSQIGNVAVLLEKGSEADHFDTLELYIQRWLQEEDAVIQDCFERNFTESNEPSARRQAEWAYGDLLSNQTTFTTGPEKIRRPEFKRHLDPYDWYPKSRTEVYANARHNNDSHSSASTIFATKDQCPSHHVLKESTGA